MPRCGVHDPHAKPLSVSPDIAYIHFKMMVVNSFGLSTSIPSPSYILGLLGYSIDLRVSVNMAVNYSPIFLEVRQATGSRRKSRITNACCSEKNPLRRPTDNRDVQLVSAWRSIPTRARFSREVVLP